MVSGHATPLHAGAQSQLWLPAPGRAHQQSLGWGRAHEAPPRSAVNYPEVRELFASGGVPAVGWPASSLLYL